MDPELPSDDHQERTDWAQGLHRVNDRFGAFSLVGTCCGITLVTSTDEDGLATHVHVEIAMVLGVDAQNAGRTHHDVVDVRATIANLYAVQHGPVGR